LAAQSPLEESLEQRALALVIDTRTGDEVEALAKRKRRLPEDTDTHVVEIGARRVLIQRDGRHDKRREAVDRILFVVLREEEHAGLPP
jgi:hypothetical protein